MRQEKTNVLIALKNILERNSSVLTPIFRADNTANAAGDSLEYFIKDMFCTGASQYQYDYEKEKIYDQYLSWKGNSSNFPDFIIHGGVGVEPKKLNNLSYSNIALNSSYPKSYIYPNTQNIPAKINEPAWKSKEIIYVVGNLNTTNNKLNTLWFVYGNTMIADSEIYLNLITDIRNSIKRTDATLKESKELARAIGIDPLKHSNLRVRGMYELKHPQQIFTSYITMEKDINKTYIYVVILKKDFDCIIDKPDFSMFFEKKQLIKNDILIPNPNGKDDLLEALIFEGWTN
ncbi:restriction endonuclease [Brochothrix thermosphacta]|uniref:NgoPII family restriction endonuclease n=1 Tax=Brochothrix thermosphacta TaxID=2756 RepID=UPI00083F974D|nr:NgoPII family restriction endonuclease [Brochothrix thermosphacta]ODJ55097.1 restriction endonuclease [Brochothrix thermosphacta]HCZ45396.1 NgoPII family restriction endonuclease [Brochothrix thermosphacta]